MDIPPLLHRAEKALLPIFSEIDAQVKENLAKILLGKYGEAIDFPKWGFLSAMLSDGKAAVNTA